MRGHRTDEHQAAVSRRLALLSAELAAVRAPEPAPTSDVAVNPWAAPATHTRPAHSRLAADRHDVSPWGEPPEPTRIRAGVDHDPPVVPMPGRHARRRHSSPGTGWPMPAALSGRVSLGAPQLVVVLVMVAVGLAMTCWWLVRGSPEQVAVPPTPVATGASPLVTGLPTGSGADGSGGPDEPGGVADAARAEVVVDVAGKVRRPGIAVLDVGSRVVDALDAAGGARAGVDLRGLNLARVLVDGEQILVGVAPVPGIAAGAAASPSSSGLPAGGLVPLNSADQVVLESLPDVGPVTAAAILSWRDEHGAFTSVDELLEVDGIGEATLARLAPLVTL